MILVSGANDISITSKVLLQKRVRGKYHKSRTDLKSNVDILHWYVKIGIIDLI